MKRRSRRDDIIAFNAADAFYASAAGVAPKGQQAVPPEPKKRGPSQRREAPILKAILSMLRKHPLVATVERRQVGVFSSGNRTIGVGRAGDPDITGILHGGRAYAIEVKAPGAYPDERQKRRLEQLKAIGAVVGVARSVEDAERIIND